MKTGLRHLVLLAVVGGGTIPCVAGETGDGPSQGVQRDGCTDDCHPDALKGDGCTDDCRHDGKGKGAGKSPAAKKDGCTDDCSPHALKGDGCVDDCGHDQGRAERPSCPNLVREPSAEKVVGQGQEDACGVCKRNGLKTDEGTHHEDDCEDEDDTAADDR